MEANPATIIHYLSNLKKACDEFPPTWGLGDGTRDGNSWCDTSGKGREKEQYQDGYRCMEEGEAHRKLSVTGLDWQCC
jgi:hypothetical protein